MSFYAPTQKLTNAELRVHKKVKVNEKNVTVKASYHTFSKFRIVGVMASHWIPNLEVLDSKPLGGSKVDSAFHPSKVDEMSTRNSWRLSGKK